MSKRVLTDLNMDDTSRCINMPDPVNNGDGVPKNFILKYNSEALTETSTTSTTTYSNKTTLVTPSLPLGDYIITWSLKWRAANANRGIQVQIVDNTVEQINHINFSANVNDFPMVSGRKKRSAISGVHTIGLNFRVGIGATTIFVSEALLTIERVA